MKTLHFRSFTLLFLLVLFSVQPVFAASLALPSSQVSAPKSTVVVDKTLLKADGQDFARITVQLVDDSSNPVADHVVRLTSNHPQDKIGLLSSVPYTDSSGKIHFVVASSFPGASKYTAIDVTGGTPLLQTVSIAYVAANEFLLDVGGEFPFFIDTAKAATGSLHHFQISGLPTSIQPNQNVNFSVTAQDDNGQTVQNYTGVIHFSSSGSNGSNVILPDDYTFKAEDLGTHQFSLGLSFKAAGNYKILVNDLAQSLVSGSLDVTVGSNSGGSAQQQGSKTITVDAPMAGTYSQKAQLVTGQAQAGSTVKIYDTKQEIGSVQAGNDGRYSFQTASLADGSHSVYAVMFDSSQTALGTSGTVDFSIDTAPPKLEDLSLLPNTGIQPGTPITVTVMSEQNLSQAALVFNGDITQLNPSLETPGSFIATVQAPSIPGVYPMDAILVDQLGNSESYKAKAQITVSTDGGTAVTQESVGQSTQETTQQTTQEQTADSDNTSPSQVTGLIPYAGDKKVTLVWDAATDTETYVKHYRVYFGTDAHNLDQYVDTKDASATWYIPNLKNGTEYFFAVTAFDSDSIESVGLSEVVTGTPFATEAGNLGQVDGQIGTGLHSSAENTVINNPDVNRTPDGGPELIFLFLGSGVVAKGVKYLKRKK